MIIRDKVPDFELISDVWIKKFIDFPKRARAAKLSFDYIGLYPAIIKDHGAKPIQKSKRQ